MKTSTTVIFFFTFISLCFSQTNFRPGFIITNQQDTLHGNIDYRGDTRNMKTCRFKKDAGTEAVQYKPGEVHAYRFTDDGKFYISKYLDLEHVQDTVFVEYLLKGITDLYFYRKGLYNTYLLEKENGELYELNNNKVEVKNNGEVYLVENNKYLGILNYAFGDCKSLSRDEIYDTELSHKSLIKITKQYHDYVCEGERCIIYEKEVPVLQVALMPIIGYSVSGLKLNSPDFSGLNLDKSFSPYLGLGLDWKLPRINEKFSLLTQFVLKDDYYFGKTVTQVSSNYPDIYRDYHLYSTNASISLALKYTYPKGKIVPTFYAGGIRIFEIDQEFTKWRERRLGSKIETSKSNLSNNYQLDSQAGFILGAGVEFPVWDQHLFFSNLSFSKVWSLDYIETFNYQRIRGTFSIGYIF